MAGPTKIENLAMELFEAFLGATTPQGKKDAIAQIAQTLANLEFLNTKAYEEIRENLLSSLENAVSLEAANAQSGVVDLGFAAVNRDVRDLIAAMRRSLLEVHCP